MMLKLVAILAIFGAAFAIPLDEEIRPPAIEAIPPNSVVAVPANGPIPDGPIPAGPAVVPLAGEAPANIPPQEGKPDSDLKTDSTFWWGYYPSVRRYYVPSRPRSFYHNYHHNYHNYHYYNYDLPTTYTYWQSYW